MDSVRTIIVDDEQPARRGLKTLVERHAGFTVVAVCRDGREAIARITELKPDLVLLDIQMPEITGFDVIARLPADAVPVVIFVTAYDEFAIRAFEVRALDYLLKPVSQARFDEALDAGRGARARSPPRRVRHDAAGRGGRHPEGARRRPPAACPAPRAGSSGSW